jgi:hypothetical protein
MLDVTETTIQEWFDDYERKYCRQISEACLSNSGKLPPDDDLFGILTNPNLDAGIHAKIFMELLCCNKGSLPVESHIVRVRYVGEGQLIHGDKTHYHKIYCPGTYKYEVLTVATNYCPFFMRMDNRGYLGLFEPKQETCQYNKLIHKPKLVTYQTVFGKYTRPLPGECAVFSKPEAFYGKPWPYILHTKCCECMYCGWTPVTNAKVIYNDDTMETKFEHTCDYCIFDLLQCCVHPKFLKNRSPLAKDAIHVRSQFRRLNAGVSLNNENSLLTHCHRCFIPEYLMHLVGPSHELRLWRGDSRCIMCAGGGSVETKWGRFRVNYDLFVEPKQPKTKRVKL